MISESLLTEFAVMAYLAEWTNMKQRSSSEVPSGNPKTINVHNNNNNNNTNNNNNVFRKDRIAYVQIGVSQVLFDAPSKLTVTSYL
jgi:hypothetical protein